MKHSKLIAFILLISSSTTSVSPGLCDFCTWLFATHHAVETEVETAKGKQVPGYHFVDNTGDEWDTTETELRDDFKELAWFSAKVYCFYLVLSFMISAWQEEQEQRFSVGTNLSDANNNLFACRGTFRRKAPTLLGDEPWLYVRCKQILINSRTFAKGEGRSCEAGPFDNQRLADAVDDAKLMEMWEKFCERFDPKNLLDELQNLKPFSLKVKNGRFREGPTYGTVTADVLRKCLGLAHDKITQYRELDIFEYDKCPEAVRKAVEYLRQTIDIS